MTVTYDRLLTGGKRNG